MPELIPSEALLPRIRTEVPAAPRIPIAQLVQGAGGRAPEVFEAVTQLATSVQDIFVQRQKILDTNEATRAFTDFSLRVSEMDRELRKASTTSTYLRDTLNRFSEIQAEVFNGLSTDGAKAIFDAKAQQAIIGFNNSASAFNLKQFMDETEASADTILRDAVREMGRAESNEELLSTLNENTKLLRNLEPALGPDKVGDIIFNMRTKGGNNRALKLANEDPAGFLQQLGELSQVADPTMLIRLTDQASDRIDRETAARIKKEEREEEERQKIIDGLADETLKVYSDEVRGLIARRATLVEFEELRRSFEAAIISEDIDRFDPRVAEIRADIEEPFVEGGVGNVALMSTLKLRARFGGLTDKEVSKLRIAKDISPGQAFDLRSLMVQRANPKDIASTVNYKQGQKKLYLVIGGSDLGTMTGFNLGFKTAGVLANALEEYDIRVRAEIKEKGLEGMIADGRFYTIANNIIARIAASGTLPGLNIKGGALEMFGDDTQDTEIPTKESIEEKETLFDKLRKELTISSRPQ